MVVTEGTSPNFIVRITEMLMYDQDFNPYVAFAVTSVGCTPDIETERTTNPSANAWQAAVEIVREEGRGRKVSTLLMRPRCGWASEDVDQTNFRAFRKAEVRRMRLTRSWVNRVSSLRCSGSIYTLLTRAMGPAFRSPSWGSGEPAARDGLMAPDRTVGKRGEGSLFFSPPKRREVHYEPDPA